MNKMTKTIRIIFLKLNKIKKIKNIHKSGAKQ